MFPEPIEEPERALRAALVLLRLTGLVSRDQLLASSSDAEKKVARSSLREPGALDLVQAPQAERIPGALRARFYASMPLGLRVYRVYRVCGVCGVC